MNKNVEYFLKNRFENYEIDAAFDKIFNISDGQLKCKNCTINTEEAKSTGEIEKKEENKILKISDNQN
jgi:hypothetical protein